jgi:NadR type nicotinamide-nucleotide adenylyltransferase
MKRIVVIGPESTGKSTICEQLSSHYKTKWVPEFARAYLLKHGTEYSFDDLLTIAKGQLKLQSEIESQTASDKVIVDTDMYVMKVWCEFVFDRCHQFILDHLAAHSNDLYLLCNPDLPWVKDELREYPDQESRIRLYHIYKDLMVNQQVPWLEIRGSYNERLETAITGIDRILS